ncbi:hypothetical protein [Methylosinus sp. Ce-a6]|uniref:hypothetical protein n=1 Tax=Methylosinus sp. Ce-a6 TaxID=2172005 RepID=UPI001356DBC6|nr:hypothetical protein [Methylosinus sp. Ce-a6]
MRLRPLLLVAAVFAFSSALPLSAGAEDTLDPSRLDPAAAGAAKAKPKKNKQPQASSGQASTGQAAAPGKPAPGKVENRQYGELEGWSPGKTPPKKDKKDDDTPRFGGRAPVSMGNGGNMSVGMPF